MRSRIFLAALFTALVAPQSGAVTTTTSYKYDELGRVKTVNYNDVVTDSYSYDAANNRTQKQSANTDLTAPSAPGAVSFSNLTQSSADASWTAATDNAAVAAYEFRLNSAAAWTAIGNFTSVSMTGLSVATAYTFDVRAKDAAGNIGPARSGSFTTASAAVSISNRVVQTQSLGASATYQLASSGDILVSPARGGLAPVGYWLSPQSGMNTFEARATLTSSTACNSSAVMGTWLNLGSNRSWSVSAPSAPLGASKSCTFTLEIRLASNPATILGSAQIVEVAINAP